MAVHNHLLPQNAQLEKIRQSWLFGKGLQIMLTCGGAEMMHSEIRTMLRNIVRMQKA